MISLSSISLLLSESDDLYLTIASPDLSDPLEQLCELDGLRPGERGRMAVGESKSPIVYDPQARTRGRQALTLRETKTYFVAVHQSGGNPAPDLSREDIRCSLLTDVAQQQTSKMTSWRLRKTNGLLSGEFRLVNYIGVAWIEVKGFDRIRFDVAPDKFDYETEYRSMVESIADQCQQLLLEWNSPTSLSFCPDPTVEKRLLLEQFLFLRHCLGADRLDLYLEILRRNPHRALYDETEWQGEVVADRFYRDPLRYGRDWTRSNQPAAASFGGFLPREVQGVSRQETLDTPPNRFVKFALSYFREICQAVIDHEKIQGAAQDDALAMRESLDSFLSQRWLLEISALEQVPLNNQTLLKREGYRQVLEAWFLSDVAAQLDWEGREDAYDGDNRDVATLYEFWLYFEIFGSLRNEPGCYLVPEKHHVDGNEGSFLRFSEQGGLSVNLKQGKTSRSRFVFRTHEGVSSRLHFYYNRSFSQEDTVLKAGTYSRTLCPDYTLVVFPEEIANEFENPQAAEREAETRGQITYLHFDAKYRISSIVEAFGDGREGEVKEEKREAKVTKTYQRGDLYKMHTYNEAIRRTVGSYVLYPGDSELVAGHKFLKYHEILPGVGAFAMRPGYRDDQSVCCGRDAFAKFLTDVIRQQGNEFSQLRRINSLTHEAIKEKPLDIEIQGNVFSGGSPSTPVVLGYVKPEREEEFKGERYFYCRATNQNGVAIKLDLSMAANALFAGYTGGYNQRVSLSWCAVITSCRIVTPNQLKEYIGRDSSGGAELYLFFRLKEIIPMQVRDLRNIAPSGGGLAVSSIWKKIASAPKVSKE